MAGKPVRFLMDSGATYSVLTFYFRPMTSKARSIVGVEGKPKAKYLTQLSPCLWGNYLVTHKFPVMLECPTPLLGRDFFLFFFQVFI